MTLRDILLNNEGLGLEVGGFIVFILTFVQILPIKVNPWSWIARSIGRALNKDLTEKVEALDKKVNDVDGKVSSLTTKVDTLEEKVSSITTKVDTLEEKVDESEKSNEERNIILCRARMLRFGDEILHEQKHSKDHFDQILVDCTDYTNYCNTHPGFLNNITEHTIDLINRTYDKCLQEKSFL